VITYRPEMFQELHAWAVGLTPWRGGLVSGETITVLARSAEDAGRIGLAWWRAGVGPNEDPGKNMVASVRLLSWVAIADAEAQLWERPSCVMLVLAGDPEQ